MSIVTQETLKSSDLINWTIFQELLLMDEDEEEFALSLVETFVQQANETFGEIESLINTSLSADDATAEANLQKISQLGHYLKGSAAALGLQKVQDQCERLQNYGKKEAFDNDPQAVKAQTAKDWFHCSSEAYDKMRGYFDESKDLLSRFFEAEL
jgi:osomolarity two-component system phosphorelay intermediate protein YPD1